jgi:hypothetical protein
MRRVTGHDIGGILGMSSLLGQKLRVDCSTGELRIQPSGHSAKPSEGIPLRLSKEGAPVVAACVEGRDIEFVVDTGLNMSGVLAAEVFDDIVSDGRATVSTRLVSLGRERVHARCRINAFTLGRHEYEGLVFARGECSSIGLGLLSRHVVTLDFANWIMSLGGDTRPGPEKDNITGLHLWRIDDRTVVEVVDRGSPAAEADIRPGDEMLRIDGVDVNELDLAVVRARLAEDHNRAVRLKIRRGGTEYHKDVAPKKML